MTDVSNSNKKKGAMTREKEELQLIKDYENILMKLEQKETDEGVQQLRTLLQNKLIQEQDFKDLRRACYLSLGNIYENEKKMYDEALHYYNKAVMINPVDFQTWFKMGLLSRKQGFLPQSETCLYQALQYKPSQMYENVVYEQLTATSLLQERWDTTVQKLDVMIQNGYKVNENMYLKGFCYSKAQINPEIVQNIQQTLLSRIPDMETFKKNLTLLTEYNQYKNMEKKNVFYDKLNVQDKQFTIYVDKLTWQNFLRIINEVLKLMLLAQNMKNISKKTKKTRLQPLLTHMKENNIDFNTTVILKEKRENMNIPEFWTLGKLSKNAKKQLSNTNIQTQQQNSQQLQKNLINQTPQKLRTLGLSQQQSQQSNNPNNEKEGCLDLQIREIAKDQRIPLKQKLNDVYNTVYSNISQEAKDKFQNSFKKLISNSNNGLSLGSQQTSDLQLNKKNSKNNKMEIESSAIKIPVTDIKGKPETEKNKSDDLAKNQDLEDEEISENQQQQQEKNDEDEKILNDQKEKFKKFINDDFLQFFLKKKQKPYCSIIQLVFDILEHFLLNRKFFNSENYFEFDFIPEFTFLKESLKYCPSPVLKKHSDQNRGLKDLLMKILIKCQIYSPQFLKDMENMCHNSNQIENQENKKNQNQQEENKMEEENGQNNNQFEENYKKSQQIKQNMSLTIFEIILEYYQHLKIMYEQNNIQILNQGNPNNQDLIRKRKKLQIIQKILNQLKYGFLFNQEEQSQVYQARAYYSLSIYFSEQDFFNEEYAQQCSAKFKEIVDTIQDSRKSEQFKGYLLNVFWLDQIYVKMNFQDILETRLTESKQKIQEIFDKLEKQRQGLNQIQNNIKKQQQEQLEKEKKNNQNNPVIIIDDDDEEEELKGQEEQKLQQELLLKEQQRLEELEQTKTQINDLFKQFQDKIFKNSDDAFDLFYKKMHEMILKVTDLKIISQYYSQIFGVYIQCVYNHTLNQETTKNILNLDLKFKIEEINTHFQNRFYHQTEVKKQINYEEIKDYILNLNLNFLKIIIIKLFYIDFDSHSKWFRVYYITTKYLIKANIPEDTQDKELFEKQCESRSNFLFFVHFLFHIHKNKEKMIELHSKFLQEKLLNQELTKAFQYLEQQEVGKGDHQSKSEKNSIQESEEDEDDEDTDWDENQDEDIRVFEELRTFYKCCYGIKNRKKRNIQVYNDIINQTSSTWLLKKFICFEEIKNLCNFIKRQYPEYIKNIHSIINSQISILLIAIFEFMKQNDSDWAKCLGMAEKNKQFKKWVKDGDETIVGYIQQRRQSKSESCFCEKNDCLGDLMQNDLLCDILFMVGRAHENFNVNELKDQSEQQMQKNQKATLIKAEKMFILNILLKPQNSQVWQLLGGVYQQLTFLYFDNILNEPVSSKITDIKDNFRYCKKIYNFIKDNFKDNKLLINDIEEELTILNLLKFYERKVLYIASKPNGQIEQNPLDNDQILQLKQKVIQIQEKMYEKEYQDKLIRKVYFQELFIFRSYKQCYNSESIRKHFERLLEAKQIVDKVKITQNKSDMEEENQDLQTIINNDFDGENYDVEFQMEYYISLYKILRYYLNILKIYQENGYGQDDISQENLKKFKEKVSEILDNEAFQNQIINILQEICDIIKEQDMSLLNEISAKNNDLIDLNTYINSNKNNKIFDFKLLTKSSLFLKQIQDQHQQKNDENKNMEIEQQQEKDPKQDIQEQQKSQKIILETPSQEEILNKQENVLKELSFIVTNLASNLNSLAMNRQKKHRYKRFFYRSILYSSKIISSFDCNNENSESKSLKILQEIINQKSEDIVSMYTHTESQSIEKDTKFQYFFPRELVFLVEKYKVLKQLIILQNKNQEFEKMRLMFKKLLRLAIKKGEEIVDNSNKDNKNKNSKDQEIQEVKFHKDRYNKIFQKLYLMAINLTLDSFVKEMEKNPDCVKDTQNLPKQLHEIYTLNVKQKSQAKFLEENEKLQQKIKNIITIMYKNSISAEQLAEVKEYDEQKLQTSAIKYIEEMFKKKKAPKNKKQNNESQQQNDQETSN